MNEIKCPHDLNQFLVSEPKFENTFTDTECEKAQFYGDCYHCFSTAIASRDRQLSTDDSSCTTTDSTTDSTTRQRMTNEEAIIELSVLWERNGSPTDGRYREALDIAIEVLEERTRTHASDSSEHETHEERAERVGHWIEYKYAEESEGHLISNFVCDKCHAWIEVDYAYCPNCGVKMEGLDDRN